MLQSRAAGRMVTARRKRVRHPSPVLRGGFDSVSPNIPELARTCANTIFGFMFLLAWVRMRFVMKPAFHPHSCPVCGQRVEWSRLNSRAWIWARWYCGSCGSQLCFDFSRRILCACLGGAWAGFLGFCVKPYVSFWTWLFVFALGVFAIFRLERIIVAQPAQQEIMNKLPLEP